MDKIEDDQITVEKILGNMLRRQRRLIRRVRFCTLMNKVLCGLPIAPTLKNLLQAVSDMQQHFNAIRSNSV